MKCRGNVMIVLGVVVMMGIAVGLLKLSRGGDGIPPIPQRSRESHNSRASGPGDTPAPPIDDRADHATGKTPLTSVPVSTTEDSHRVKPASSSLSQEQPGPVALSDEEGAQTDITNASASRGQTIQASLSSGATASDSEMICLRFELKDRKLNLQTQSIVNGSMKLPPGIAPADGFYHRILSRSGDVLAQGIIQEPRMLYYDYPNPNGSGSLMGGVLMQSNVQFAVRYPLIAGMDRIELFTVRRTADISQLSVKGDNYCGSFKLNIPGR